MLPVRHYYHVYAAGAWTRPVNEHMMALGQAALRDMGMTVGLVGPEQDCHAAKVAVQMLAAAQDLHVPVMHWLEQEKGWEQVTLLQLYRDLHASTDDYAVLYMHTKGAYRDLEGNRLWRRAMTRALVGRWEDCLERLDEGFDAVGCHWMRNPEFPEQVPFFAGNFWWAKASYLRTLPEPLNETRWQPEVWVSLGDPRPYDMLPGYPSYGNG